MFQADQLLRMSVFVMLVVMEGFKIKQVDNKERSHDPGLSTIQRETQRAGVF